VTLSTFIVQLVGWQMATRINYGPYGRSNKSLQRIQRTSVLNIQFADFLINSHRYCLKYESETASAVLVDFFDGEEPKRVADSLVEFFELYLTDANRLEIWDFAAKMYLGSPWQQHATTEPRR